MGSPFKLKVKGNLSKTTRFLGRVLNAHNMHVFEKWGEIGCEMLAQSTPKKTGKTANSWRYGIEDNGSRVIVYWTNDNRTSQGDSIAILLQYGHGTGTGGYVQGRDYINPAMRPVFDGMADELWKVVTES